MVCIYSRNLGYFSVHEDLLLRFKANNVLIGGLYITVEDQERTELCWNIYEIIHKRKGFSMMLEQSIVEKKNIALKVGV